MHLLELASELERRLDELGRLQWAREECEPLALSSDERDLETIFARLPRSRDAERVRTPDRARARALARADRRAPRPPRAERARRRHAVEIAKRKPSSRAELEKIRGVGSVAGGRRAEDLLDAVRRGREQPPDPPPRSTRAPAPKPDDAPARGARRGAAARPCPRGRPRLRAAGRPRGPTGDRRRRACERRRGRRAHPQGWRRELAGAELLELLERGDVSRADL